MKRIFLPLVCCFILTSFFSPSLQSKNTGVSYSISSFLASDNTSYVEICFTFNTAAFRYQLDEQGVERNIVFLTTVIKNREDQVVHAEKRMILGPPKDSKTKEELPISFVDLQRIFLLQGNYQIEFFLSEESDSETPLVIKDEIELSFSLDEVSVSDIILVEKFIPTQTANVLSRNGYDIHPLPSDILPEAAPSISYYAEIYHTDKSLPLDSLFLLEVHLEYSATNQRVNTVKSLKKTPVRAMNVAIGSLDISSLPSGGYYLVVGVRDAKNILHSYNRTFFEVQNDSVDALFASHQQLSAPELHFAQRLSDSILEKSIEYLYPIALDFEKPFLREAYQEASREERENFLFVFWVRRNNEQPQVEFQKYLDRIKYVDRHFKSSIKKGYQTDMGMIYLIYGPPANIIDEKFKGVSGLGESQSQLQNQDVFDLPRTPTTGEGVAYLPYQMWFYKETPAQERNRVFVFYAPQLDLSDYILLHSNAAGEIKDPFWERTLSRDLLPEGLEGEAGRQFRRGF